MVSFQKLDRVRLRSSRSPLQETVNSMRPDDTITAHTLLHTFLEMRMLSPRVEEWTEAHQSRNPPRLIRLRRLQAMFRAFGIAWNPRAFEEGDFIDPADPRYAAILRRYEPRRIPGIMGGFLIPEHLARSFAILLEFRVRVHRVLDHPERIFASDGPILHALELMTTLATDLRASVRPVDDALAELISPEGAAFELDVMRVEYGYPDVDLCVIDAEWE